MRFSPTMQASRAPSAKSRKVFGESHKGSELHPSKNHLPGGLRELLRTFSYGGRKKSKIKTRKKKLKQTEEKKTLLVTPLEGHSLKRRLRARRVAKTENNSNTSKNAPP